MQLLMNMILKHTIIEKIINSAILKHQLIEGYNKTKYIESTIYEVQDNKLNHIKTQHGWNGNCQQYIETSGHRGNYQIYNSQTQL